MEITHIQSILKTVCPVHTEYTSETPGAKAKSKAASPDGTLLQDADFDSMLREINRYLELTQTDLEVEIHKETKTPIFRVIRKNDGKVISEVPPREVLNIGLRIKEMAGLLFKTSG